MADVEISPNEISEVEFQEFGEIIQLNTVKPKLINQGNCLRFNDLANLDFNPEGRPGISIFQSRIRSMPYKFDLVERHPHGSQFFYPMDNEPFLVIVAPDLNGTPGIPKAYITEPFQGINFHRGTWHGVLTPFQGSGFFLVVDWLGSKVNLEEYVYSHCWSVQPNKELLTLKD